MREPVLLPTSGNICDLNTMKRILLNDEHDPFNRAPLKMSELKELPELKARIDHWIAQKKAGVHPTDEDLRKMGNSQMQEHEKDSFNFQDDFVEITPGTKGVGTGLQFTMS